MSKKSFTIIVLMLLAIIGFAGWYFFFRAAPEGPSGTATSTGNDLFPFGQRPVATSTGGQDGSGQSGTGNVIDITDREVPVPKLRQLWKDPTAGEEFLSSGSTTVSVRFVDRATGHLYESPVDSLGETQLSNVTIPQIYEALIVPNGTEILFRYLKEDSTIQSFYARLATSTGSEGSALDGYFLPQNIRDIAMLGTKILYFDPSLSTGSLIQSNVDGTKRISLMNTDFTDWSLSWNATSTVFLSTRPSGLVDGHGYLFNIPKGSITKIVDSIKGLTGSMSPLGGYVFLSANGNSGDIASASYDIAGQKTTSLSIDTLSDKCAWSNKKANIIYCGVPVNAPKGTYPDDWYQGNVSFSDSIWEIDMATGEVSLVLDPSFDAVQEMDIIRPRIDPSDSFLTFINKKDMSLWLYKF